MNHNAYNETLACNTIYFRKFQKISVVPLLPTEVNLITGNVLTLSFLPLKESFSEHFHRKACLSLSPILLFISMLSVGFTFFFWLRAFPELKVGVIL